MKTVLIINQKGGVGKTTLADQIAFELEDRNYQVSFANLDNQGGSIHSSREVEASTQYQIVDTPGVLTDDFGKWCAAADCILIPTLASEADRHALLRCYDLALGAIARSGKHAPVGVVINCFDVRGIIDREFLSYLTDGEKVNVVGTIPRSVAFRKAQLMKVAVGRVPSSEKAAASIKTLVDKIEKGLI